MKIDINNAYNVESDYIDLIYEILDKCKQHEGITDNVEVSISIVDNVQIQQLNNQFRKIDAATDVLSFPMFEHDELNYKNLFNEEIVLLGDIVISFDKVLEQAKEYGHSIEREIAFLIIHGFLHLIGYDHIDDVDRKIMFAKQDEILNLLGLVR